LRVLKFLARRALLAVLVMLTVLTISFALTRLSGDVAVSMAGPQATQQDVETIRKAYGLDRPLPVQFLSWVADVATGDLGRSYLYHAPVGELIRSRLGPLAGARGGAGLLLETLDAYFATGGVATQTAARLHLSVRAVTYRLARVQALLGIDPTDPAERFALHAAVLGAQALGWPDIADDRQRQHT